MVQRMGQSPWACPITVQTRVSQSAVLEQHGALCSHQDSRELGDLAASLFLVLDAVFQARSQVPLAEPGPQPLTPCAANRCTPLSCQNGPG